MENLGFTLNVTNMGSFISLTEIFQIAIEKFKL